MKRVSDKKFDASTLEVLGDTGDFELDIEVKEIEEDLRIYTFRMRSEKPAELPPITLRYTMPALDIWGVWHPNSLYDKRLRADWEAPSLGSRVSVGAPILTLFGTEDENKITVACLDAVNHIWFEAPIREEDNLIYVGWKFFSEPMAPTSLYETEILVDTRTHPFFKSIQGVSEWWNSFADLQACDVPKEAFDAVYSTWYAYHQSLDHQQLLAECKAAYPMGYRTIIIDDGWQTMDSNRGYDYTGDWEAQRLVNLRELSDEIHELGMKVMIWYSVPFCGKKSKAYQRFKGKFLTENHRWAPVFDPRYPEVRQYLVDTYCKALKTWNLDGFKLDFIDDFKVYPETPSGAENGRDTASVYQGTKLLVEEIYSSLKAINPEVLIEFRQEFIGPVMQKCANMFRAFDCPNDAVTNRIRTTDVRLLNAKAAVHSDMLTWHSKEKVEVAAEQILNILFSVPQISVRLQEVSEEHRAMISFLTTYWVQRREVFMHGTFEAERPVSNYPLLRASSSEHMIIASFEKQIISWQAGFAKVDIVNAAPHGEIYLQIDEEEKPFKVDVFDCMGNLVKTQKILISPGILTLEVPRSGIALFEALTN